MTPFPPEVVHVDVGDVELGVVRWRAEAGVPVVFAVHSFTANAWSWSVVARHLAGRAGVVAIDLRGRGFSHAIDGPFGIRQHADDLAAVIDRLNASPAVVVGHSMGASVALAAAERHPDAVADVVLVDGGIPISMPRDADPDERLEELLGSAIGRLGRVWPDRVTYRAQWTQHPAFVDLMSPEIERYALSDLHEVGAGFRATVSEVGVRVDGTELLLDEELRSMLERRRETRLVVAEFGLDGAPPPLIGDDDIAPFPQHRWRRIPDTNHYSIVLGDRGAAAIADDIVDCLG